ncbi:MAG: bifunctional lysine ketoglutarate reductase /saccharopine dehydrogenase family protein [Candidatus Marinimicrobia bacterium]|nr:bifunctional lysine ketoglutarate reductase /saccharopine dehydrogenase family protein [Candidatus Neomarinimicrobiota bacterium]
MRIGIRREDKNEWEARVPLIPNDVKKLVNNGIEVFLQPSPIRIFSDQEYIDVGATISEDLSSCSVILAVKEIPINFIKNGKTYVFFSHTIKGQDYNMPLLQKMIDAKTQLIDYERIVNENGQRLIFFGRHAGLAGMIDSLWALGKRFDSEGVQNPFSKVQKTYEYRGLENAKRQIGIISDEIKSNGIPKAMRPLICGFSGYGNVSQGAQEIFDILPLKEISPQELLSNKILFDDPKHVLYKVVFKESDLVETRDLTNKFELQDYYDNPDKYKSKFERYIPKITMLMNCIYWDTPYPRLITLDYLKRAWSESENQKLKVIGDISCDIDGAIQCTVKSTEPGNPVYIYNPLDGSVIDGVEGEGPVIMAVDNLPCELAEEASKSFSKVLVDFIPQLVNANYNVALKSLKLPEELRRGMILYRGKLTPEYKYLEKYL